MKRWSSPESPTAAFVPDIPAAESKAREKENAIIDRIHKVCAGGRSSSEYRAGQKVPRDSGDRRAGV